MPDLAAASACACQQVSVSPHLTSVRCIYAELFAYIDDCGLRSCSTSGCLVRCVLSFALLTHPSRAAQLEKLENKIEHLVNALATTQSQRGFSVDLGQPSPPLSHTSTRVVNQRVLDDAQNSRQQAVLDSLCDDIDDSTGSTPSSASGSPGPTTSGTQVTSPIALHADYTSVGVPMAEAEVLLDRYRRLMSSAMPFVIISPTVSAQQLYAEKPTLLHAIVVVSSWHDIAVQQVNVKRLLRNLSERIMIHCEKSIDILQAILVFVGWYHPHMFWSQQCTNLLHLAMAMLIDLGFDRSREQCGDLRKATAQATNRPPPGERTSTPEEDRILAGLFYLTSTLSCSFKKMDAIQWTDFLAKGLNKLETEAEYDSDLLLVQICRLQHIIEETSAVTPASTQLPLYIKSFKSDLATLRKADPNKDPSIFLQLQYIATEVLIYEISLNDLQENRDTPLRTRVDELCNLIDAIKAYLDLYFTLPISAYLTMPFSLFAQFAHAFVVLIKVASLEIDGWDFRLLTDRLDFLEAVETAALRFEGTVTSKPDGLDIKNDHFVKWAIRIRWMKQVYEAKFLQPEGERDEKADALKALFRGTPGNPSGGEESDYVSASGTSTAQTPATTVSGGVPQQQPTPPDDVLSGDFFNYLDENFWSSFAGDYDLGYPEVNMVG